MYVRRLLLGTTFTINPRSLSKCAFESLGNFQHQTVREAPTKNRNSERHPIFGKSGRTRSTRKIENVGVVRKLKEGQTDLDI